MIELCFLGALLSVYTMLKSNIEDKNIFLKYINVSLIMVVFSLHIAISFFAHTVENQNIISHEDEYNYYLDTLEGEFTDEKEQFIINENQIISNAKIDLKTAYNDYYDGAINKQELDNIISKSDFILANEKGFNAIYEQFLFVRENPDNRFFLNTNAFSALFNSCSNVYFVIIYIILITIPMFCKEHESNMFSLLMTYQNGGKFLAMRKVLFVISTVFLLFIADVVLRYTFFTTLYGDVGSNYPLQSLAMFSNSSLDVTLFQAYIIVCTSRLIGSILFSLFLLFVSLFLKQSIFVALAGLITVFTPLFLTIPTERYIYIAPFSLIVGTGYLMGDVITTNIITGEKQVLFLQPSTQNLILWFMLIVCLMIIMYIRILRLNANLFSVKKHKITKATMCLLFVISLSGCSVQPESASVYNSINSTYIQDETYIYYTDKEDTLLAQDKQNGELQIISPVFSHDIKILNYYADGQYLYYSYIQTKQTSLNDMLNKSVFRIVGYNSILGEEVIVYEQRELLNNSDDFSIENQDFFVSDDYLFFYANNIVLKMNRSNFAFEELNINSSMLSFDGDYIYYIGDNLVVHKYEVDTNKTIKLNDIIASSFYVTDETIIYINRADGYKLYESDKNGENLEILIDDKISYFYFDENDVYVMNNNNISYPIESIGL